MGSREGRIAKGELELPFEDGNNYLRQEDGLLKLKRPVMILVRLVRVRLFADGGGGKALACHLFGGDDRKSLLDSNQEHYSIEIASNYYRVEVVVL